MTTTTLNTTCYTIRDGKIIEGQLHDFEHFIESTTRPSGVGYKHYVKPTTRNVDAVTDDDGNEIEPEREEEIWALAYWMTWGGPERIIRTFETEEEADAAAEAVYVEEILSNEQFSIYLDRESAEEALKQMLEDQE